MAKDIEINYFEVTVKLQEETDAEDRAGNPKIKKWQEKWVVHAKNTDEATKIVTDEYVATMAEWRIANVKELPILGVLGE